MSPHMELLREMERLEADLRVATFDEDAVVPTTICPAPLPGKPSSKQGQQIAELDYSGAVWSL